MSVTLQERRERAESRIDALLSGMDDMVRMAYESLLTHGADHGELTEKQAVARLEGFHDYIVVREETGVDHPGLEEYIEVKKRLGDELISFGTGKHRLPIEGEGPAPVLADEPEESVAEETVEAPAEPEAVSTPEVAPTAPVSVTPAPVVEAEETSVARSIFSDDDDDVVIEAETDDAEEAKDGGFVARVPEAKPEPAFEELLAEDREAREEQEEAIAEADEEAAPRISANDVIEKDFSFKMGGYDQEEVDDFLDETAQFMAVAHPGSAWLEMARSLTDKEFPKKGAFKKGYAPTEVHTFLDELKVELEIRASEA